METFRYGNEDAQLVLIQAVDAHDLAVIENEVSEIRRLTSADFQLIAVKTERWNHDLSPWKSPAVFGREPFGDGAEETLTEILRLTSGLHKTFLIGGYSLSGLFALWAAYQTGVFSGTAAASPSVWFPGFTEYMNTHEIRSKSVYLSLGRKEPDTRNPVMAAVGDRIRETYTILQSQGVSCILEWNQGNHFRDTDIRTAKAFAWLINHLK